MALNLKCFTLLCIGILTASPLFSQEIIKEHHPTIIRDSTALKGMYENALKDISVQNYPQAETTLKEILSKNPGFDEARISLIRLSFLQKKMDEAEIIAKEGTQLAPKDPLYWSILTDLYKETKNYKALLPIFDQLISLQPEELKNYLDKAFTYSILEDYNSAFDTYNLAEEKFGDQESIYAGRSALFVKTNENDKAIDELKGYLSKHPDKSIAYLQLAHLYLDLKEPNKALEIVKHAEESFPNHADVLLTKADAYQQLKQNDKLLIALKKAFSLKTLPIERKINIIFSLFRDLDHEQALDFSEALGALLIEAHPDQANAYAVYGDILLQQSKNNEALLEFKKALNLNPKMPLIWEKILQIEVGDGQYKMAQQDGPEAIKQAPNNSMIFLFTGYAFLLDKQYDQARPYIEEALNYADPQNKELMVQIYSALGDLYNAISMYDVSNVAYDEALALDSNNTYILNNYAYYLSLRKEKLDKASALSKLSNELQPENSSFQDTYAWVLFQKGDYAEALIWIDKALKGALNPSSTLLEHKGDILSQLGNSKQAVSFWKAAKKVALKNQENINKIEQKIKNKKYVD